MDLRFLPFGLTCGLCLALAGCFEDPNDSADVGDTTDDTSTSMGNESGTDGTTTDTTDGTTTDTTDGTTTDTTDGTTTDTTDGVDPFCGDGNVDPDEECDDGDNGPGKACLTDCVLNVCGDADVGPDEVCDDGENNVLALGACAPDCSTIIEQKRVSIGAGFASGNLGPNPVAAADSLCEPGYKALFAVPGVREATNVPYGTVGAIDWVLQPYTAYTRMDDTLIWVTDETPLLGVRDGSPEPLINAVDTVCQAMFCLIEGPVITGLQNNWISPPPLNCNGWSSGSAIAMANYGNHEGTTEFLQFDSVDCEFVTDGGIVLFNARVYCIEQ